MTVRRILTIDGGGIKGAFPASFLATLEKVLDRPIGEYFDLIAGTSTGGIIALGLGLGFSAQDLSQFYADLGSQIFNGNRWRLALRQIRRAKYTQEPLRRALESKFAGKKIGDSKVRLVIPSMNVDTGKVYIYKTAHHPHLETDYKKEALEAALATTAAPTFFPTHLADSGVPLIDGGMWANNPAGLAVVEAIGILDWSKEDLRVLSVGCTAPPFDLGDTRRSDRGIAQYARRIADVFMAGQSSASLGTTYVLAGHKNVYRYNPVVPEGRFSLDSIDGLSCLRGLGESEAREALPHLKPVFFREPAEAFRPCYTISDKAETQETRSYQTV